MKRKLTISSSQHRYPVNFHRSATSLVRAIAENRTMTVAQKKKKPGNGDESAILFFAIDRQVHKHYRKEFDDLSGLAGSQILQFLVPSGEQSKSIEMWQKITDYLLEQGVRRNTPVIAVGGGVTGDLAGFAASTVMRGLPLIQVPTTLLAMVDSSVGGKTGINHKCGKNLIGSFYPPRSIELSTEFLATLPPKEWMNGVSEILKYGAISDPRIFQACRQLFMPDADGDSGQDTAHPASGHKEHTGDASADGTAKFVQPIPAPGDPKLVQLIEKSIRIKAAIVEQDEKESGARMFLNFGHTFAHALEKLAGYGTISHGEAVFIGMIAAVHLSNRLGASVDPANIERFSPLYPMPELHLPNRYEELTDQMYRDKKRSSSRLKLILLQDWGAPYVTETDDRAAVMDAWRYAMERVR